MKVAVATMLPTLEACVGDQSRRSKYLLIIDLSTLEYEALVNPLLLLGGPAAGKMFAQLLFEENVRMVLTSTCSSYLSKHLGTRGIQITTGISGSVHKAIGRFRKMCLAETIVISLGDMQD